MFRTNIVLLSSFFIGTVSFGQPFVREVEPFPVTKGGVPMTQPCIGGIDSPNHRFVDIDSDGDYDLFIFDSDFNVDFYRNEGTSLVPQFQLRPHEIVLPRFSAWFYFVDLNGDTKLDLLCDNGSNGISYYINQGTLHEPNFVLETHTMMDTSDNIMLAGFLSVPSFADLDGDNDYDFFTSDFNGNIIWYENIGTATSPAFRYADGQFQGIQILNDSCLNNARIPPEFSRSLHGGSIFFFVDIDGDQALDLFLGDMNSYKLFFIKNFGTATQPDLYCTDEQLLPESAPLVTVYNQPNFVDIDGDGDVDLFVGTFVNMGPSSSSFHSFWFYENQGSATQPNFQLITKNYISTLDVGKNAHPVFVAIDDDNDFDLVLGNLHGQLWYFRNDGTSTNPRFTFVDSVFGGISGNYSYAPAFADVDNDGDDDLFIGRFDGRIKYYRNDGTPTTPMFTPAASPVDTINVAMNAVPVLLDIDGDGDFDLFVGRANGTIRYYRNDGNATKFLPVLVESAFNGINVGENSKPTFSDFDADGDYDLFVGNAAGKIFWWENTGTATAPSFEFQNDSFGDVDPMLESAPAFCDIDGDGDADLFVGTSKGGIQFYRNQRISNGVVENNFQFSNSNFQLLQNYPNPFNPRTILRYSVVSNQYVSIKVYDIFGREVATLVNERKQAGEHQVEWNAEKFSSGVYLYSLSVGSRVQVKKMILIK